jgi:homocysteine S-methyltransferase
MIDKTFFQTLRILDGGMGQELLSKGLKPTGTLWSAYALMYEEYHQMVIDTHIDFINAGAEVITTSTFTARKGRLEQNNCLEVFEKINKTAVELAQRARDIAKKDVLIAGSLPNQKQTYSADLGEDLDEIKERFSSQAKYIKNGIDFFFLDVMGSGLECDIALESIAPFNLPALIGVHLKENGKLPSEESITDIVARDQQNNWLGLIVACASPNAYEMAQNEFNNLNIPYGFKLNAFDKIPENYVVSSAKKWGEGGNPSLILGINEELKKTEIFYQYVEKFMHNGATILGGCCEIGPEHIRVISQLKKVGS